MTNHSQTTAPGDKLFILHGNDQMAEHNASAGLLRLPVEVKDQIFSLVFGASFVHVRLRRCLIKHTLEREDLFSEPCTSGVSEPEDKVSSRVDEAQHESVFHNLVLRHQHCDRGRSPVSLKLLQTCRQIYKEAKHTAYRDNVFSFDEWRAFDRFCERSKPALSYIRKLHLHMCLHQATDMYCWSAGLKDLPLRFTSLRSISLDHHMHYVNYKMKAAAYKPPSYFEQKSRRKGSDHDEFMRNILNLQKLPLTKAVVVVDDFHSSATPRWTFNEKQGWAKYVKETLLSTRKG